MSLIGMYDNDIHKYSGGGGLAQYPGVHILFGVLGFNNYRLPGFSKRVTSTINYCVCIQYLEVLDSYLLCSTIYENGTGLCNTLWGGSFVYTPQSPTDPERTCLSFYWPENETNPNDVPIRNIFGRQVDTVTPPPCNGGHRVIPNLATGAALMLVARWAY